MTVPRVILHFSENYGTVSVTVVETQGTSVSNHTSGVQLLKKVSSSVNISQMFCVTLSFSSEKDV